MEFLDEYESKPRFLFRSKHLPDPSDSDHPLNSSSFFSSLHKPTLFISVSISILIFTIALIYFSDLEPLKSILLWLSLSFFLGPFAPPSLTAGDIRVGVGAPLKEALKSETFAEINEKYNRKSSKKKPSEVMSDGFVEKSMGVNGSFSDLQKIEKNRFNCEEKKKSDEEREWSDVDEELLKKLMVKHPVGKPGRWEAIADGFKGRRKVESVIMKSKELGERKNVSDQDSYKKFLKDRKPVDKRVMDELEENESNVNQNVESGWSSGEDLALLNALKTFPKDVTMRWEKIAASLPGKTKSACVKRVADLKKDFRSSKSQAS
ncbi:hypothetical protein ACJIZ3_003845 [Penstemon smallii]|uniref:Myb-like domain-containing protein n=1 Tax=Penstemon smallii TaxID=265156 RepID=A0ABD3S0F3_9LAMI